MLTGDADNATAIQKLDTYFGSQSSVFVFRSALSWGKMMWKLLRRHTHPCDTTEKLCQTSSMCSIAGSIIQHQRSGDIEPIVLNMLPEGL